MSSIKKLFDIIEGVKGEKRGDYEDTKLITKRMSPADAAKASDDILKEIVKRGGASASAAAAELKKRETKVPEKGSEKPEDDPKNMEDDPKKKMSSSIGVEDISEESHKALSKLGDDYIKSNKDKIKSILEHEDESVKKVLEGVESVDDIKASIEKTSVLVEKSEEMNRATNDHFGDDEEDDDEEDDTKNKKIDWEVTKSTLPDFKDKEIENQFKQFMEQTSFGKLLNAYNEVDPSELTNVAEAKETLLGRIVDLFEKLSELRKEREIKKKEDQKKIDDLVANSTEQDLEDLIKKGGQHKTLAKAAQKEKKRIIHTHKDMSVVDLKNLVRKGGDKGLDAEKELNRRRSESKKSIEAILDKYKSLSDVDYEKAKELVGAENAQLLVDLGKIKKGGEVKGNTGSTGATGKSGDKKESYENLRDTIFEIAYRSMESMENTIVETNTIEEENKYQNLHSTILETNNQNQDQDSNNNYRSLHNMIRRGWDKKGK